MILKEADDRAGDIEELRRLAAAYPHVRAKADREIANIIAGANGEENAAHILNRYLRDARRIAVLHDIRIDCGGGDYAQIDHLIINRIQCRAWILETKNYRADLSCNEHREWTAYYNHKPMAIPSPVEQAKRQAEAFRKWMANAGETSINEITPVVLINPRSRMRRDHLRPDEHVVKADNIISWIDDQNESMPLGKVLGILGRHLMNGMDEDKLRLLGRKLCSAHVPAQFDWACRLGCKDSPSPSLTTASAVLSQADKVAFVTLSDGSIAVRHPSDPILSEAVQQACRGIGRWNPRYRNWIIPAGAVSHVRTELAKF